MFTHFVDEGIGNEWSIEDVCSFGYPILDFTSTESSDNRAISNYSIYRSWIECGGCDTTLEFPKQPHFCDGGFATTLNTQLLKYYPECSRCFCVLAHPWQPHRCPDITYDSKNDFDWIECELCACVLDYPRQKHRCPDYDCGFAERSSDEEEDGDFHLRRQRL